MCWSQTKSAILTATCLLSTYLMMLPPDTGGTLRTDGRGELEKMTHGPGGITEPY